MPRPRSDIAPRLIKAAQARFLELGVDGASLRDIARDANTNIGMVYYYFPTKDDLFLAVIEEHYARVISDFSAALAPELSVQERLNRLFVRIGDASAQELEVMRLILREALVSSTRLERLFERFQRGHIPLFLQLVKDGLESGTFDRRHNPIVLMISIIALGGVAQGVRKVMGDRLPFALAPQGAELSHELVEILLAGVRPNPSRG